MVDEACLPICQLLAFVMHFRISWCRNTLDVCHGVSLIVYSIHSIRISACCLAVPVPVPDMTYNVFSGTLNPTHTSACCPPAGGWSVFAAGEKNRSCSVQYADEADRCDFNSSGFGRCDADVCQVQRNGITARTRRRSRNKPRSRAVGA